MAYLRIITQIDESYGEDAFRILQWLVYSARPLSLSEIAEVLAIEWDDTCFSTESRLTDLETF